MSIANENHVSLGYDTTALRQYASQYAQIAKDLRSMAKKLDTCLRELKEDGWTTPAGTAFHEMTEVNWEENIEKYADLLDTLKEALEYACKKYENLTTNHIERVKL